MKRTNLRGHALRAEGKPWEANGEGGWMRNYLAGRNGHGLCECGATSGWLYSDADRRRWHARHKDGIRKAMAADPRVSACPRCGRPGRWGADDDWCHEEHEAAVECTQEGWYPGKEPALALKQGGTQAP